MKLVKAPSGKFGTIGRTYYNEIQPIKTFADSKSAIDFKGFEALHNTVLDIDDQLLPMSKRKLDRYMMNSDDRLRRFSESLTN